MHSRHNLVAFHNSLLGGCSAGPTGLKGDCNNRCLQGRLVQSGAEGDLLGKGPVNLLELEAVCAKP